MAWTAPMTAVANTAFTAAQFNTNVRDNLNETAPAKATAASRIFVTTGVNAIAERQILNNNVAATESTTSTAYADLTTVGPAVTVTTGTAAIVFWAGFARNTVADVRNYMSVAVSGASSISASDNHALILASAASIQQRVGTFNVFILTAGSNTFTAKYRTLSNSATFADRSLMVIPL